VDAGLCYCGSSLSPVRSTDIYPAWADHRRPRVGRGPCQEKGFWALPTLLIDWEGTPTPTCPGGENEYDLGSRRRTVAAHAVIAIRFGPMPIVVCVRWRASCVKTRAATRAHGAPTQSHYESPTSGNVARQHTELFQKSNTSRRAGGGRNPFPRRSGADPAARTPIAGLAKNALALHLLIAAALNFVRVAAVGSPRKPPRPRNRGGRAHLLRFCRSLNRTAACSVGVCQRYLIRRR